MNPYSGVERRTLLLAAKRSIDSAKALSLEDLPYLAISEVVQDVVTLTKCACIVHYGTACAFEFDGLCRTLMEKRNPRGFRSYAARIVKECEARVELIGQGV